jgi:Cft2 family RNA processing exonuclease
MCRPASYIFAVIDLVYMEFVALGNTSAIGASCLYLKINQTGIMLDAGADPEHDGVASLPRFDVLKRHPGWYVDHAIVTHAHHDHIGALPVAVREFPHVIIHMTKATRQLADVLLPASARLQRRKQREGSTQSAPLFSEEELELHSYLYLTHELEHNFALTGMRDPHPITGAFYSSGHILGSAGVLISYVEDGTPRRLFYTSDTSIRPQGIIPGGS